MKSILFVIPWSGFYIGTNYSFAEAPERAPEGVVGLATYLQTKGASVKIADMQRMLRGNEGNTEKTLNDLWTICDDFRPDVIGFSFFTARFEYARDIFVALCQTYDRRQRQKPLIIAGGVHPTLLPNLTFEYIPFDALVIGEGENPLLQLLEGASYGTIKGFFLPGDTQVIQAEAVANLDELPIPDWSLIDKNFYSQPSYQISNVQLHQVMPITFGRGCMYRCNFCAHSCFLFARHHSANYFIRKMNSVPCRHPSLHPRIVCG